MTTLTQIEIKNNALAFINEWKGETRERAEAQSFWNDFFAVFGLSRKRIASFEEPVKKLGNDRGSIDLFWKGTLMVEHKSAGKDLSTAYKQALDYFPGIKEVELPKYVLVSDFSRFRLYDLEESTEVDFSLNDFPEKLHLFGFISGYKYHNLRDEDPVNVRVAEKMGELHDALSGSGYKGHNLETILVRLVYCLFADDTGIFPRDHFHYFIEHRTNANGFDTGSTLSLIFQILNTPNEDRQSSLDEEFQQFPYVNGHLFEENLPIPVFNARMRAILLESCEFDWGKISPAIFGSMFQSVMNKELRRNLGAHYTSEKNILKVVRSLFLDELLEEYERNKFDLNRLKQLHERISKIKLFDPACGCGNFLIISYRELRTLELSILRQQRKLSGRSEFQLEIDTRSISKIDVDCLYGIEIEEFPAKIAEVAIWLMDHIMNMELSHEFATTVIRLPLKKSAKIVIGNALRIDWNSIVQMPQETTQGELFILGNPPFIGKQERSPQQVEDMDLIFGNTSKSGVLDYVCCWYMKATQFIEGTRNQVAFVSTNSITQGEQVSALWQFLLPKNIKINFGHRTFRWMNEARGKAAVFCVIIGFAQFDRNRKVIFDYENPDSEPVEYVAKQINPYLIDATIILIPSRNEPICNVPPLNFGSMPNDGGYLLLTKVEKEEFLKIEPGAEKFIRPLISAREYLHGEERYCLWLKNVDPTEYRNLPEVMKRIEAVRKYRLTSKRESTRKLANYPGLFGEIRQPEDEYIVIPRVSSENRRYIAMSYIDKSSIANDSCLSLPHASLYHFGVLHSTMHMAWVRQICGRLEGRYRYSSNIVYNNYPWPEAPSKMQIERVSSLAQRIIEVRGKFSNCNLATLYDPLTMPKELVDAHRKLDEVVDGIYRKKPFGSELERLEFLISLYQKMTEPLINIPKVRKR